MLSDLLQKEKTKYKMKGTGGNLEVMRFIALIMMMVLWVYTYLQIHQVVHIKYLQLFLCQSYVCLDLVHLGNLLTGLEAFPVESRALINHGGLVFSPWGNNMPWREVVSGLSEKLGQGHLEVELVVLW